jgi:hypothetical protein
MMANYEWLRKVVDVPCEIGDTVYTYFRMVGDYLRKKKAPYPVKVLFIGINGYEPHGGGFINVEYPTGRQYSFNFSDFGKSVFLTREEAEKRLKEMEGIV